ncbi:MAG: carboxypeptidase-like regulatory domain-containing protein [Bacteroidales bacterium]
MCIKKLLFILSFSGGSLFPALSFSQERVDNIISGIIKDKEHGNVVQGARITLTDPVTGKIFSYGFSDYTGAFSVNAKNVKAPWRLEASSIGYKSKQMVLERVPEKSLIIEIESSDVVLNEVKITAPKVTIKGDTLNFTAPGFMKEGDRSVEEMLKRIPGVEITEGGQILYNNNPINALYIDGKNMLDGKYSIATKNLPPDIVSMVQIFENHQPVKALKRFSPTDNAAINLKLKPEAKARWVTTGDIAAGYPGPMFDSKALLFRFGSALQTMNVIKGNNRGKSIGSDTKSQLLGASAQTQLLSLEDLNLVNVTGVTEPPLGEERSLFNTSGYISANAIFNMSETTEATLKVGYSYEKKEREQQEWTDYYLPEGVINRLGEESLFSGLTERPEFDFVIKSNSEGYFLQNRLNFRGRIDSRKADLSGTNELYSNAYVKQFDLSEAVTWIKPYERSLLKISSNSQITESPQRLAVSDNSDGNDMVQEANFRQIVSDNKISYIIRRGAVTAETGAGANFRFQKLNHYEKMVTELYIAGRAGYERERLKFNVNIPLKLRNSELSIEPEIGLRYRFSPYWEGSAGYNRNVKAAGVLNMYNSPFMVNYRYFYTGYDSLWLSRDNTVFIRGIYNNPLKLINISATLSCSRLNRDVTQSSYLFDSSLSVFELSEKSTGNLLMATLNFAKSFFNTPLLLDLKIQYLRSLSAMVQQGVAANVIFSRISVTPKAELSLGKYLDLEGMVPFSRYVREKVAGIGAGTSFTTANPQLNVTFRMTEKVTVMLNNSVYINEISKGDFDYFPFCDFKARIKRGSGEFYAEFTNLFNNKSFKQKIVSDLFISERVFRLRPVGFIAGYSFTF